MYRSNYLKSKMDSASKRLQPSFVSSTAPMLFLPSQTQGLLPDLTQRHFQFPSPLFPHHLSPQQVQAYFQAAQSQPLMMYPYLLPSTTSLNLSQHQVPPQEDASDSDSDSEASGTTNTRSLLSLNQSFREVSKSIDREQFLQAVALEAAKVPKSASQIVDLEKIDWIAVSRKFSLLSPDMCRKYWDANYAQYSFAHLGNTMALFLKDFHIDVENKQVTGTEALSLNETNEKSSSKKQKKRMWTEIEKQEVERMHEEFGNRWTLIAERLGTGRSGTDVKNYWHNREHKLAIDYIRETKKRKHA